MKAQKDLAYRLVLRAARRAPPALTERLQEEWAADLASRSGALSRLYLAANCWWAMGVITRDLAVPQVAASATGVGAKALLGGAHYDFPLLSRRTIILLVIAGLHLLLIYGLASGFAQHVVSSLAPATHLTITQEDRPHVAPPPIVMKPLVVGRSEPNLLLPTDFTLPAEDKPAADSSTGSSNVVSAGDALPAQPVIHRVVGGPGAGFPDTADFYPAAARRAGETGATTVQVCVDPQGRLTANPLVTEGSGFRTLDDGALSLARAASGHYRPTTENGRPVSSCYPYRIRFRLSD